MSVYMHRACMRTILTCAELTNFLEKAEEKKNSPTGCVPDTSFSSSLLWFYVSLNTFLFFLFQNGPLVVYFGSSTLTRTVRQIFPQHGGHLWIKSRFCFLHRIRIFWLKYFYSDQSCIAIIWIHVNRLLFLLFLLVCSWLFCLCVGVCVLQKFVRRKRLTFVLLLCNQINYIWDQTFLNGNQKLLIPSKINVTGMYYCKWNS